MASRLSPAAVGLFCQVLKVLVLLGWGQRMSALGVQWVCLYVCGLIALDTHPTNCRIARFLPACCHDAPNRLLRKRAFSTEGLMARLVKVAKTLGEGYLILDDVVVEKFGTACPCVGSCWSTSQRKGVLGLHIVVVVWCSFLLCFDSWYAAGWLGRWLMGQGIVFVTQLPCDRQVAYQGQAQRVDALAERLRYRRGEVKERWQLEVVRQGHPEPMPLRGMQKVTLEPTA